MELIKRINKDYIDSVKSRNLVEKNLLSIVKGDIQKLEKSGDEFTESEVLKIIQKMTKSLNEVMSLLEEGSDAHSTAKEEISILEKYLPKMMSKEEVIYQINKIKSENPNWNIGIIMASFKDKPVDKKMVKDFI